MTKTLFKSINISDDIGHPERFAHYYPTSRSVPLLATVLKPEATMVIASYGSGKSLASGIGALAVENNPASADVLRELAGKTARVDPKVAETIEKRIASRARGKAIILSGYVKDLPLQICTALNIEPLKSIRGVVAAIRKLEGIDHIAIVWDEFGRHLEGLVRDARSRDLDAIQDLSELIVRPSGPSISLTLLLHQNVLAYAQSLNQTSRNEWRKIEGRFEQMRFVEDSKELYALIAQLVNARSAIVTALPAPLRDEAVSRAIEGHWFDEMSDADEMRLLQERAWPLSAAALQVLPRLVARVGQNERSLFSFVETFDFGSPVGMDEVYDAFSEAIRSDVGVGGLHRQWVEVESARNKADTALEREALSAAFLLQAGISGERRHLKRSVLVGALISKGAPIDEAEATLDALVKRKLLIHRKLNDEVSVWHGADVDVAARLREERIRIGGSFDLMEFLEKEHPAPFIRPTRHNVRMAVSRYLSGKYVRATDLDKFIELPFEADWGRMLFVIANTAEEVRLAHAVAKDNWQRTILIVPSEPIPVHDAALDVEALLSLKKDDKLLSEDPLVGREIDELLAISRRHLTVIMHRLTTDRPSASEWWSGGARLSVNADRPAGIAVSDILDGWYPKTPKIINDQIVRTKLSRQMSTARIRVITRLMVHAGTTGLGYAPDDGSAEASVYRTVLQRTGLHVDVDGHGAFAEPRDIADPGLSLAWEEIRNFFTTKGRKPLAQIMSVLSAPPLGVAAGLLPILVMAGYKAFAKAVTIHTEGQYVRDILGFDSMRMFKEPDNTVFDVHSSSPPIMRYLDDFAYIFLYEKPGIFEEKIMFANMALEKWLSTVAEGARRSKRMPDKARSLLRSIQYAEDPALLIMETLPNLLGPADKPFEDKLIHVLNALQSCRNSIDGLEKGYLRDAVDVVEDVLHLEGSDLKTVDGVLEWAACFDVPALMKRQDMKMTDQTLLRTVNDTRNGRYSAEGLARVISQLLMKRGVDKWQDDTKEHFRKELREARERIETVALDVEDPSADLIPLIESRMMYLANQLERIKQANKI
ncbi:hypothetical protein G6L35_05950 [Agrobacterium tumefaciens]|uniref:hypothetical protein n=1 Tax=Agrobacterium tumefaciens TaxID=358 RepID=UPI0015729534|nr:hypothetical protein [Agrobacterium tumefaciens]NSZ68169.1 hypothetical protein [Agrobacterium tumefaciens]